MSVLESCAHRGCSWSSVIARHLQGRAAGQQADPDLPLAADDGDEGHHLAVRRNRRRLFQP